MGKVLSKTVEKAKETHAHRLTLVSLEGNTVDAIKASELCKRVVTALPRLEKLAINKSLLQCLPAELALFNSLVLIDLEDNHLAALPDDCLPPSLKEVFLAKNRLTHLPNALVRCSALVALDLHANEMLVPQLSAIDRRKQTVFDLPLLEVLNLAENKLDTLPPLAWSHLLKIQRVVLDNNLLRVFPSQLCLLASLMTLSLSHNHLTALPEEIAGLTSLTDLDVGSNAIDQLPNALRHMTRLKTLDIRRNKLIRLPNATFATLYSLSRFFAQENQLTEVPIELGRLPLTMLHLQENQIASVPSVLFHITSLVELLLDHNRLTSLPSDIHSMPKLSKLHLNNNQISELPDELRNLTAITVLLLNHNLLRQVPVALLEMNVMRLSLSDNPLDSQVANSIRAKGALSVIRQAKSQFATPDSPPLLASDKPGSRTSLSGRTSSSSRTSSPGSSASLVIPPPPYEEWRLAFEAFLAQMNLARRDELLKLPLEQKWLLLQTWRKGDVAQHLIGKETVKSHRRAASTGAHIPGSPGGGSSRQQDPEQFLALLANDGPAPISKKDLVELRVAISSRPVVWIDRFCSNSGLTMLLELASKTSSTWGDTEMCLEAMRCVAQLQKLPTKARLLCTAPQVALLYKIAATTDLAARAAVLAVLNTIATEVVGHQLVLDTLKASSGTNPFELLVTSFFEGEANSEAWQLHLNALLLINTLLRYVHDHWERFSMRNQLFALGINDFINVSSPVAALKAEQATFLDATTEDFEIVLPSHGLPALLREISQVRVHLEAMALMDPNAPVIPAQHVFVMVLYASVQIAFLWVDPSSAEKFSLLKSDLTVASTIRSAVAKEGDDLASYGLYVPAGAGTWLDPQKPISGQSGEVLFCQYKLRPWSLTVQLSPSKPPRSATAEVDPNSTVLAAISVLRQRLNAPPITMGVEQEYSLYLSDKDMWLEDTKKLLYYPTLAAATLLLKRKPVPVKLLYNDTAEVLLLDGSKKVQEYLAQFAAKVGVAEQARDYGLLLARAGMPPVWLQGGNFVDDYRLTERDSIRFCLTPRPILIELPSGERVSSSLDFQGEVIGQIMSFVPTDKRYAVYVRDGDKLISFSRASLRLLSGVTRAQLVVKEQTVSVDVGQNLWEENIDANIRFEPNTNNKEIKALSVNQLIIRLTIAPRDARMEEEFFLLRSYVMSPEMFVAKLLERFDPPASGRVPQAVKALAQTEVLRLLERWLRDHWSDAQPSLALLESFIMQALPREGFHQQSASLAILMQEKKRMASQLPPQPKPLPVPRRLTDPNLASRVTSWAEVDELEVARQLTLELHTVYKHIRRTEFTQQAWNKQRLQFMAPNLLLFIQRFNELSAAVVTAIVREPQVRNRARIMTKMIHIAQHLRNMNNLHYLQAMMVGINGAACLRLKWTRERLPREAQLCLAELEALMSMQGSFHIYRDHLAKISPPCVPYIGVCLSDLTFAEDGNPDRIDNLISWSKISLIYRIIFDATRCQAVIYDFAPNAEMAAFLGSMPSVGEEEQYRLSLLHEPRNALKENIK